MRHDKISTTYLRLIKKTCNQQTHHMGHKKVDIDPMMVISNVPEDNETV